VQECRQRADLVVQECARRGPAVTDASQMPEWRQLYRDVRRHLFLTSTTRRTTGTASPDRQWPLPSLTTISNPLTTTTVIMVIVIIISSSSVVAIARCQHQLDFVRATSTTPSLITSIVITVLISLALIYSNTNVGEDRVSTRITLFTYYFYFYYYY